MVLNAVIQPKCIAIVHDWLVTYAGAEKVLEQIVALYPQADVFTVCDFLPPEARGFLQGRNPISTFIQNLPFSRRYYRQYLPLMPLAIEQLDLSDYDLVISSSHAVAKGVLTGPDQLHISYVHSPIRYAWDLQHQYLKESGLNRNLKGWVAKWFLHKMRLWDARTANGVDHFVANSHFIARRIWKTYRREAEVIYPPVDLDAFELIEQKDGYYITASRLVPYKKINLIVEAFAQMPTKHLKVIGDGPDRSKIEKIAAGCSNIEILGYQDTKTMAALIGRAEAFVFAAEEDFGIALVEAQACGTPVIAYGRGGALETVRGLEGEEPTGCFFDEQTTEALVEVIEMFERNRHWIDPQVCRRQAERFSVSRFRDQFSAFVSEKWDAFNSSRDKDIIP